MTGTDRLEPPSDEPRQAPVRSTPERAAPAPELYEALADRLVRSLAPATALHVGYDANLLVEALRARGVDAHGTDLSPGDGTRREDADRHGNTEALTSPLPRRYDLILCLDGLDGVPDDGLHTAIAVLCDATDDIILSPSVDVGSEDTTGAHPPHFWARAFAELGFVRDLSFDASIIGPWAMRFRRGQESVPDVVSTYERTLWTLRRNLVHLQELAIEGREREHVRILAERDREIARLQGDLEITRAALTELQSTVPKLNGHIDVLRAEVAKQVAERVRQDEEIQMQRARIQSQVEEIARQGEEIERQQRENLDLRKQMSELTRALQTRDEHWELVQSTLGYRLIGRARAARNRIAPPGSRREQLWFLLTNR